MMVHMGNINPDGSTSNIKINPGTQAISVIFEISEVKAISPRSKVAGVNAHAHLGIMDRPHASNCLCSINMLDTIFPRSRSYVQGQRSLWQNDMPMQTYTSWIVHIFKLANVAYNNCHKIFSGFPRYAQVQGCNSKVNGQGGKVTCPCTPTPNG